MIFAVEQVPIILQFLGAGYKCSGSCEIGYTCSPNCKELAKEVEEVHDDCHYFALADSNHSGSLNFETMEEVINTRQRKVNCYLLTLS
jgi:hypothetical protein